jgi:hypothetical protein
MKTLATLLFAVMGLLIPGLAPHAYADANSYLDCVAGYSRPDWPSLGTAELLALGREAFNGANDLKNKHMDQPFVREILALREKHNLSESVASAIFGCAYLYQPF